MTEQPKVYDIHEFVADPTEPSRITHKFGLHYSGDSWCDFKVWAAAGWSQDDDEPLFNTGSESPEFIEFNQATSEVTYEGYIKWDGCCQYGAPNGFHYDSHHLFDADHAALRKAIDIALRDMKSENVSEFGRKRWPRLP